MRVIQQPHNQEDTMSDMLGIPNTHPHHISPNNKVSNNTLNCHSIVENFQKEGEISLNLKRLPKNLDLPHCITILRYHMGIWKVRFRPIFSKNKKRGFLFNN